METVHRISNKYLGAYISKSKKEIVGSQYADLVTSLKTASETGFMGQYDPRLIERIIQIFLKDHHDLYYFSTHDQLRLLQGFDEIVKYLDSPREFHPRIRKVLIEMTLNTASSSDQDQYDLMQYYSREGILDDNEYLLSLFRQYVEMRFDYMDRPTLLKYADLLKDLGMLFNDKDLILKLEGYVDRNYYLFELSELFQLMKLQAYCFYRPPTLLSQLQDAVGIRIKQQEQLDNLQPEDTLNFIEALSVGNVENREMSKHLAKMLRVTDHLERHQEVPLFALSYFADFDLKFSENLQNQIKTNLSKNLQNYSLRELSYLLVAMKSQANFSSELEFHKEVEDLVASRLAARQEPPVQADAERLALALPSYKLNESQTRQALSDIEHNSNLVEMIEQDMLKDVEFQKNQLVCDGRIKASFVVNSKFLIEIDENNMLNYKKAKTGETKLMSRGRICNQIAQSHGYSGGYIGISLLEMEYSQNEAEYLLKQL